MKLKEQEINNNNLNFMVIQDILKGNNKTYKNDVIKFCRGGIESENYYSFIPFASITRIRLGQLPPTITWKTILGGIVALIGLCILPMGKWWVLLGLIAIVGGIVIVRRSWKSWYALNIEMASGSDYAFVADDKKFVDEGYKLLLGEINKREENRGGNTYNFGNGTEIKVKKIDKVEVQGDYNE